MYCIRRAALRSAVAASRQVAPKASTTPFAAQAALRATTIPRQTLAGAARCFSQTARSQNVEEKPESALNESEEAAAPAPRRKDVTDEYVASLENGVFIRNLIFDATDKHLTAAFEKFGKVVDAHVARDARGLSKGYGFVYFENPESVEEAIRAVDGTFWHGRRVHCSVRNAKTGAPTAGPRGPKDPSTTLYIGNIPYETTDAELNNLFKDLDNVTDIRVAVDRTTGWPRGFAHADFSNLESAVKAYEKLQGIQMGNRTLSIDYSETRKFGSKN
ncbi:hypothetical protein B0T14DRAFT_505377 [Immersiella caudata]|uniref:RRM domain-containing protein n=1 Tax=Immersiella caudata TaxID=314043 RepID=A0AA39XFA7_9PEZI|nr:hypothetical protein B0T14DRAFT_505377 [Immersiella caudata]